MRPRSLLYSIVLVLGTIAAGVAVRFVQVGLPPLVMKYAGSMLWAATIYWVASTVLGRTRLVRVALIAGCVATAVEFFKLYRSSEMDAFRGTLAGILLLGRYFSVWDIVAYWLAIVVAAAADSAMRRRAA